MLSRLPMVVGVAISLGAVPLALGTSAKPHSPFAVCRGTLLGAQPDWSKDGRRIVLLRPSGTGGSAVWTASATGKPLRPIWHANQIFFAPRLSPDARRVAIGTTDGYRVSDSVDIFTVGGQRVDTISNASDAAFSPDGSRLVVHARAPDDLPFGFNGTVDVANLASGTRTTIATDADYGYPDWSSSNWIVYVASAPAGSRQLVLIRPDGSDRRILDLAGAEPDVNPGGVESEPRWSPRGDKLAVRALYHGRPVLAVYNVATRRTAIAVELSGLGPADPTWSPDGRRLIFIVLSGDEQSPLYEVDVTGRGLHPLATRCQFGTGGSDILRAVRKPIFGLEGNDRIYGRDGSGERIDCGPGRDTVFAEESDVISPNCERRFRP